MTSDTGTTQAPQSAGWRGTFAGFALGLSIFSILWFAIAAIGTKLGFWTWQVGLGQMTIGWGPMLLMAAAGVSVLAVIIALIKAPRKQAAMLAGAALLVSGLALGRVAAFGAQAGRLPPLHDIQTDWSDPIRPSDTLTYLRESAGAENPMQDDPVIADAANGRWPGLGGRRVAEVQEEAEFNPATQKSPKEAPYPLIAPLITATTPEAAFVAVEETVEARGWNVVLSVPSEGRLEATDESFWFGFKDDVIIRVRHDPAGARIDVRSTSRVGLSDLGANSKRIRDLLNEIEERLAQ